MSDTYDPATCVTAAELRAAGIAVPDDVPDVGWVPRSSLRFTGYKLTDLTGGILRGTATVQFLTAFRWVECKVKLDLPDNSGPPRT